MQEKPFGQNSNLRAVVDAIPIPIFIVDSNARIQDTNIAAARYVDGFQGVIDQHFCGTVLRCENALGSDDKCGTTVFCEDCVLRNTVVRGAKGETLLRKRGRMTVENNGKMQEVCYLVTAAPYAYKDQHFVLVTLEDITELTDLKNITPICAYCKKIRNDDEYWEQVEAYFQRHTGARFSHGICPDCLGKLGLSRSSAV